MIEIGFFPMIQRDLFLSRMFRRQKDIPADIATLEVAWEDMLIKFASTEEVTSASLEVDKDISLPLLAGRLESLLDCGAATKTPDTEWILKYSTAISKHGTAKEVIAVLCDRISSVSETGETIGVMKIKRRSISEGHAKIRVVPAEDSLQIICRHTSAQGLKAVFKSLLWRLRPQYGSKEKDGMFVVCCPRNINSNYNHNDAVWAASQYGVVLKENHRKWPIVIPVTIKTVKNVGYDSPGGMYFLYRDISQNIKIETRTKENFLSLLKEAGIEE